MRQNVNVGWGLSPIFLIQDLMTGHSCLVLMPAVLLFHVRTRSSKGHGIVKRDSTLKQSQTYP